MAIFFQFRELFASTALRRASSSITVHFPMDALRFFILEVALVVEVVVDLGSLAVVGLELVDGTRFFNSGLFVISSLMGLDRL